MVAFNYISVLRENCDPVEDCGPEACAFTICEDLDNCGAGGASLTDADFELDVSGVVNDAGECPTVDAGCAGLNNVFLSSGPQSGASCQCILAGENRGDLGTCVGGTIPIAYAWAISKPGCDLNASTAASFYTPNDTVWRIQAWLGRAAGANGDVFELEGAAALAALATLCAEGEVTLPWVDGLNSCGADGATVKLRSIFP